ncbi:MAG TPA: penicillin-binding protein 2 [Candidatus Saccharimonadia bacterium]|nr:penicillin-binding protein 2 [Candidatus Saccharimonadia bacterium]
MVVKYRIRLYIFTIMLLTGFGALAQRLWNLSVERNEEFVHKIPTTKEWRARVPGTRGEVKDRNGISLVANKPSFEVRIDLKTLVDEFKKQLAEENKGKPSELQRSVPMRKFLFPNQGIMRSKEEIDIVAIFDEVIIGSLNQLGLSSEYNANNLRVHYRTHRGVVPWAYRSDLSFEEFAKFAEHRLGLPGVHIEARPVRQYLYDSFACHALGYVAGADVEKVSEEEIKEWDSYVPDDYGVAGLEKTFDDDLRGRPGIRTWLQNEKGRLVREISYQEPRKGNDVYLTLDARIQMIAENALRESTPAIGRGAVVVLNPTTGEVLAMASVPSYNPNKFIPAISRADLQAYNSNPCNPLLNRSVRSFVPGSTYKIMTSLAGIIAGVEKDVWNCPGGLTFGNRYMQCWIGQKGGAHGSLRLSDAIKQSCNCYFYKYGNHAGDGNMTKAGDLLGLGTRTGIELEEEDPGILPTRRWWSVNRPKEPFSESTIANISIGQGAVQASPLQMAGVAAAVANGGIAFKPHLLKKVMDGNELVREQKADLRANFADFGLTTEKIELVRKGMWRVVMEDGGTARAARIENVEVAGKTGTAQNWRHNAKGESVKDNHTLFITFAPYVNPKFACCILVQGGKGGGVSAAPIAKRIMEQALALETGYTVPLAAVREVEGNFNPVEVVSFEGMPPVAIPGSSEEEAGDSGDNEPQPKRPARAEQNERVRAVVRAEADEEGSRNVRNNQEPAPRRANLFKRIFGR